MIRVCIEPTLEAFRAAARPLLRDSVAPERVLFEDTKSGQTVLWADEPRLSEPARPEARAGHAPAKPRASLATSELRLPAAYLRSLTKACFHRDPERFALFYRLAYRLTHGEPSLMAIASDVDVSRLRAMLQSVERDEHNMHAFVRFRRVELEAEAHFVAWHRPDHPILRLTAPFFRDRFASMRWTILTPDESAHWDGTSLRYGSGAPRSAAPAPDQLEALFAAYYSAIFNPARLNLSAMRAHMPLKHWATLPETRVLTELVRTSPELVRAMRAPASSASEAELPADRSLESLRSAARSCAACPLFESATQTVFGEGPADARLMLVGEQPGDEEDRAGRPFVGPAGKVLARALSRVGIARSSVYLTNAVKHFKWKEQGPRRLHDRPRPGEVRACRAWLDAEVLALRPRVIVCLGATAAQSFLGNRFSMARYRGHWFETPWAKSFVVTYHPAAILRIPEASESERAFETLVSHLGEALERAQDAF